MTHRERVMASLNFQPFDRVPKDLGGMASTGISCFAYAELVKYLGLPKRPVRVFDTGQMLALPDLDVLDALDADVVMTDGYITNAFPQPELWKPYDFNGRLPDGAVLRPEDFTTGADGTIYQAGGSKMVPAATVFDTEHAGQPFNIDDDFVFEDLDKLRAELDAYKVDPAWVESVAEHCRRVRESTDRAVMFDGLNSGIGFRTGMAQYSMMCVLETEYVDECHKILIGFAKKRYEALIPAIAPYIDVILIAADDMGTQNALMLKPELCKSLYMDRYKELNDVVHSRAPGVKTFLHSCGAIYDIIDIIYDSGFDILNPVQWSAGGHGYAEWKSRAMGKLTLWGGGVDAQHTLPFANLDEIKQQVSEVGACFAQGSGVMFNNTHNILAEITPDKVVAMYNN